MSRRDIIGIGASAGGLPAIIDILKNFSPEEPTSILLVMHRSDEASRLGDILQRYTPYKVCEPADGDECLPQHLYVAPNDLHLLMGEKHLHLRRGPRENNFRPAIDPMFRSLAVFAGGRATGVVLSGYMDDGAAGARAIISGGGRLLVQDPIEAMSPSMPRAAISAVGEPELIASAAQIGTRLSSLAAEPARPDRQVDARVRMELLIAGLENATMATEEKLGELVPFNCPDCNGVLWEISDGPIRRFRCHTGHAYSQMALDEKQEVMLERSLYDSLRSLREKAALLRDIATRDDINRARLIKRAEGYDQDAATVEAMILSRSKSAA